MNEAHIKAIIAKGPTPKACKYGDLTLVTDGHIACLLEWAVAADFTPLHKLWDKWKSCEPKPCTDSTLLKPDHGYYYRKFATVGINEAYYRCFAAPSVTWTETGKESPVLVHESEKLIAIVMPVRDCHGEPVDHADDAAVFEQFACDANDYYLAGVEVVNREISSLEAELADAQEKADDAQSEVDELENELTRKRAIADKLKTKPGLVHAD